MGSTQRGGAVRSRAKGRLSDVQHSIGHVGERKKNPPERSGTSFGPALGEGQGRRCRGQRRFGLCGNFVEGGDELVKLARERFEAGAAIAAFDHGLGLLERAADFVPLGAAGLGEREFEGAAVVRVHVRGDLLSLHQTLDEFGRGCGAAAEFTRELRGRHRLGGTREELKGPRQRQGHTSFVAGRIEVTGEAV